jgi:hypothetical protein
MIDLRSAGLVTYGTNGTSARNGANDTQMAKSVSHFDPRAQHLPGTRCLRNFVGSEDMENRNSGKTKVMKLDDRQRRSQMLSGRTADLSVRNIHIQFCRTFFNERENSPKIPFGQEKIRKSKALGPSKDEVADLACYGVGQSPK